MLRKLQISRFVSLKVSCVARANLCHLENKTNLELIVPLEIIYAHLESEKAAEIKKQNWKLIFNVILQK